ncbi:DUF1671-domain-containing protein [Terfezia boudieri ATCC MYA-4762]|uniref:DUF1671-domain-containing protein n=1 Tax=Terfezia boudieri ATCC MYA-4762 TaxID=1051890 RepID=A0A3N4LDZ8_9PEZI|nr:DUF1671-domain-containing protein [Terfezia boudieri ATCC MYA-4762]
MSSSRYHRLEALEVMVCPFCGFHDPVLYKIQFHIESFHTPDSPFIIEEEKAQIMELIEDEDSGYVLCTEETCGEPVLRQELQTHLDMHLAEQVALTGSGDERPNSSERSCTRAAETSGDSKALDQLKNPRTPAPTLPSPSSSIPRARHSLSESHTSSSSNSHHKKNSRTGEEQSRKKSKLRKLGTTELGPYATEKQMPLELYQALLKGPPINKHMKFGPNGTLVEVYTVANETAGLIPVIAKLCEKDDCVSHAWLCDGAVRHVGKQMHKEGGFCGYRNIQMMISYIQGAYAEGFHQFQGMIPSIIRLQDMIERGWDMGINTHGRLETGGIRGTRKYIGTSEAETLFASTGLPCGVKHLARYEERPAYEVLYDFVQRHFEEGRTRGNSDRILQTCRPPIYFQHAGHSMTIVGLELHTNGSRSLLVFDPSYSPCPGIRDLVGVSKIGSKANVHALLRLHRRGDNYLYKYREFELLTMLPNNKYTGIIEGFHMHEFFKSRYR